MARLTKPKIEIPKLTTPDPTKGGGGWSLVLDHVQDWAWSNNAFTPEELDTIIALGTAKELDKGVVSGGELDEIRNSYVKFLYPNEMTNWLFARMAGAINYINSQFFQFDLTAMEQGLQFTRYTAPGEHYDWHIDRGWNSPVRKLSVSVQLSDPADYKGGQLEIKHGGKSLKISKERGMMTFFPSYTVHRVTPVTKGTRYSLVAWVSGPPFK